MRIDARRGAQALALGRIGLGAAVLLAPAAVTSRWLGSANAELPVARDLARGLAARDIALGAGVLTTLADPVAGSRAQAAAAFADAVDAIATVIARRHLPRVGVVGTVVVAGGSAVTGAWLATRQARG